MKSCTYCDQPGDTDDHVPPKLLFAKPRPRLITVPACKACNQGASLDDEYLRLVLVLEDQAARHSEAQRVREAVMRSIEKPTKLAFRKALFSRIRYLQRRSPAGLYLGTVPGYRVDHNRLTRVIERTTRGLFLHHVGRRLPLECTVKTFTSMGLATSDPATIAIVRSVVRDTAVNPLLEVGRDQAFCYRFAIVVDQEDSSAWVFVLYKAISFISFTIGRSSTKSAV
ncbi:MAG TPA: hypothetical protein VJO34_07405 [Methylomirabilota bacterium]|nr:hypothetical protein [Methylomirabilota bacterium]